jgi:hypothetical protein
MKHKDRGETSERRVRGEGGGGEEDQHVGDEHGNMLSLVIRLDRLLHESHPSPLSPFSSGLRNFGLKEFCSRAMRFPPIGGVVFLAAAGLWGVSSKVLPLPNCPAEFLQDADLCIRSSCDAFTGPSHQNDCARSCLVHCSQFINSGPENVHIGFWSPFLEPVAHIASGTTVTIRNPWGRYGDRSQELLGQPQELRDIFDAYCSDASPRLDPHVLMTKPEPVARETTSCGTLGVHILTGRAQTELALHLPLPPLLASCLKLPTYLPLTQLPLPLPPCLLRA